VKTVQKTETLSQYFHAERDSTHDSKFGQDFLLIHAIIKTQVGLYLATENEFELERIHYRYLD